MEKIWWNSINKKTKLTLTIEKWKNLPPFPEAEPIIIPLAMHNRGYFNQCNIFDGKRMQKDEVTNSNWPIELPTRVQATSVLIGSRDKLF